MNKIALIATVFLLASSAMADVNYSGNSCNVNVNDNYNGNSNYNYNGNGSSSSSSSTYTYSNSGCGGYSSIPEASTLTAFGMGLAALVALRRRRRA